MVLIAGLAALLALGRFSWELALVVAALAFAFGVPVWCLRGGPARLRVGFLLSAMVVNGALVGAILYWPVTIGAEVLVLLVLMEVFTYLWTGVLWILVARTGPGGGAVRRFVLGTFAGSVLTLVSQWPWHLATWVSSPALNRLADRIEAGGALRPGGEWAGCFRVRSTLLQPPEVILFTIPMGEHAAGFLRRVTVPRPPAGWERIGEGGWRHDASEGRWRHDASEGRWRHFSSSWP